MRAYQDRLSKQFQETYQQLNEAQQKAVNAIEGPVMVIAGPGTGKTQILAARIGKILLDTDAAPSNILCLTYTDAGVIAMRKRLLDFIGPEAYKVHIHTFHAFCNEVIQENLFLFEKTSLDPISDLERIELFRELIDTFPKNHPLKRYRGDVYFEINNLQSLFSTMKREGWTPAFIHQKIDEYIKDLPNREEFVYKRAYKQFSPGDLKTERIEEEKEKMTRLWAAVNEFDRFQQLMRARNRYDFDDMINWVLRAFGENKELLAKYQEQFLYILVDEYQDTSGTQNKLVQLLINYWDKPNVFVVGDDDQSIYRFQGANVENMEEFARSYKTDLLKIVLTHNYRSTQPILDMSKTLIERNNERLIRKMEGLTKDLLSANPLLMDKKHWPTIREYETSRHEMIDLTLRIKKLLDEGIPPGNIAVIYRENKYGEELLNYFRLQKIPVYSKRSLNILEIPLAQKILMILKYLVAEHDIPYGGDEMLFEILHFNWFNIPPIEIARLSVEVADLQFSDNKTSLRRLLYERSNMPPKDLFTPGIHDGLRRASKVLEKLIGDLPNVTLQVLLENIIREAGVLGSIMKAPDQAWQMQVLTGLFDFVKEETRRNPTMRPQEIVSMVDLMEKENLSLPLIQVSGNDKGVNLLTAHGSKGLEFEYVFFAACNSCFWEKKRKPGGGYSLPNTIFQSLPKQKDDEELRRLFYVAMTRAEQHLVISYCRFSNDGKELEPSMFIAEIRQELPVEKIFLDEETFTDFQALHFGQTAPEIDKPEDELVTRLLDKFVMNVTALNNYLNCPLVFYYRSLIRIPSPKNEAAEFGSSVHFALEQLFRSLQESNKQFPSREKFISFFEWYMHRHRESFTREQFQRRLEYGQEVLANYYDKYIASWNKVVVLEWSVRNVVVQGVPLKGKLDKLEFDGKQVNIVDYKTGDPEKAKAKLSPPSEKDPNGGDYWRQAVFYKILADNNERGWQIVSTEFDFIEPDKKKNYRKEKLVIRPSDIDAVTQQIVTVWQKIQNRDFYTGCGKEDCHWCNFVKTNNLAIALHDLEEEEEQLPLTGILRPMEPI
ncbi:MAG TPA: ATP-dependent DNA helicase [Chitinophagaceae bacterium]|nr:ATP-dependent DNA helicase [Chitinophagaceae bacterium]